MIQPTQQKITLTYNRNSHKNPEVFPTPIYGGGLKKVPTPPLMVEGAHYVYIKVTQAG